MSDISINWQSDGDGFVDELVSINCEKRYQLGFLIFHLGRVLQGEVWRISSSIFIGM